MKRLRQRIMVWVGFVLSIACLYLVFRSVPITELLAELRRIRWPWVLPMVILFYVGIYFRSSRWWWLLGESASAISHRALLQGVFVGYAFNNTLPSGRLGELARGLYVSRRGRLPLSVVLGSIVNDRVFDSLTILVLVGLTAVWILPIDPDLQVSFGGFEITSATLNPLFVNVAMGSLGMVLMVALVMVPAVSTRIQSVISHLPFLPTRFRELLWGFVDGVLKGLHAVKDWRRLICVFGYTGLIWGLNAVSAYALAWAIPGLEISLFQAVGLMAIVTVCAAIPAAPGFWGLYEAGMILGFQILDVHPDQAVALAYAVTIHLVYYIPTTVLGLIWGFQAAIRPGATLELVASEGTNQSEP